jgi:hypothetical protein
MADKPKGKTGRPSIYTPELVERICSEIACGKSLRKICAEDWSPSLDTVFRWLHRVDGFSEQYARARETAADAFADEILDIADEEGDTNRNRLRVDSRKWVAAKLKPRRYGDALQLKHTGGIETIPDDQLEARLRAILDRKEG